MSDELYFPPEFAKQVIRQVYRQRRRRSAAWGGVLVLRAAAALAALHHPRPPHGADLLSRVERRELAQPQCPWQRSPSLFDRRAVEADASPLRPLDDEDGNPLR